jgi:sugar phosphate isomerase/epimerase
MMKNIRLIALALLAALPLVAADFKEHLGMQLYSLRNQFKADGPVKTLDLLKSYGITEVETWSGTGLTPEQLSTELKARGIKAVSAHIGYADFQKDVNVVIATAKTLGVQYVIVPILTGRSLKDEDAHKIAADFNTWGAALKAAGLKFGYHTHGAEMTPSAAGNGETLFDIIVRETKADLVSYEMDVFWTYQAGQDPVKLINKYPNRWVMLHLKDLRKDGPIGLSNRTVAADQVAVGAGQIPWPAVISAAEKAGAKYHFLEDETPNPIEAIPASLTYLRALKL